ncbi:cholestenol delta-isomerase [Aureococcus anophagefferens]|nr:cholestenol delta-isomerase [Aureococcus anophagefferens]
MGTTFIMNAPSVFGMVWRIAKPGAGTGVVRGRSNVKPWLDAHTVKKIHIVTDKEDWRTIVAAKLGDPIMQNLADEVQLDEAIRPSYADSSFVTVERGDDDSDDDHFLDARSPKLTSKEAKKELLLLDSLASGRSAGDLAKALQRLVVVQMGDDALCCPGQQKGDSTSLQPGVPAEAMMNVDVIRWYCAPLTTAAYFCAVATARFEDEDEDDLEQVPLTDYERGAICWALFTGLVHIFMDGTFAIFSHLVRFTNDRGRLQRPWFVELWHLWGKVDARYRRSDSFIVVQDCAPRDDFLFFWVLFILTSIIRFLLPLPVLAGSIKGMLRDAEFHRRWHLQYRKLSTSERKR